MINKIKEMYKQQGISEQVYDFSEKICADLEERFKKVEKMHFFWKSNCIKIM